MHTCFAKTQNMLMMKTKHAITNNNPAHMHGKNRHINDENKTKYNNLPPKRIQSDL